jgi:acyl carrier protein
MLRNELRETILKFLEERFDLTLAEGTELTEDTHLYDEGYIDSLDSIVFLTFLERAFSITVTTQDLLDYPINTVNEIVSFVFERTS